LTKLKQSGIAEDFISAFEKLAIRTENMSNASFKELFISGLKEEICRQVLMVHLITWLEASQKS
jgi:hypothetical protein